MFAASKTAAAAAGTPPPSTDPQFNYVTMLLHGDGTNGAQNNTFVDSSTNNLTAIRIGAPTQGSFSPYGDLWSNQFSGTGQYQVIATNAAFTYGTGDFTIEGWAQLGKTGAIQYLVDQRNSGGTTAVIPSLFVSAANVLTYLVSGAARITGTTALSVGVWFHFAVCRSGTSTKLFLNGVQEGSTYSDSNNYVASRVVLAAQGSSAINLLQGYLSNVRLVKGAALYTSNFTPSTTPLTAVSGTSLLTCQSNLFRDNSSNNFTITRIGAPSVQRFSPFAPDAEYSTGVVGGSGFFPGTINDYLYYTSGFGFSGAFTYEAWIYPFSWTSSATTGTVLVRGLTGQIQIGNSNSGGGWGLGVSNVGWLLRTLTPPTLNAWNHVVISRDASSNTAIFLNGIRMSAGVVASIFLAGPGVTIAGANTGEQFGGYMSNVRFVDGTAVYDPTQTTLTVPTAPLTAITNTSFLLNTVNAGIFDNAMMNDLVTVGDAQVSTAVVKYGTGSMKFDGTGDNLSAPGSDIHNLPGNFTVECWFYTTSTAAQRIVGKWNGTSNVAWLLVVNPGGSQIQWATGNNGVFQSTFSYTATVSTSTWNHIAVTRSGTTIRAFLNGVQVGSSSTSSSNLTAPNTNALTVGQAESTGYVTGYIDDLRITKGIARYTTNFTPPTEAFPNN